MVPIELALVRATAWLMVGLLASVPLLFIDVGIDPMVGFMVHLGFLVAFVLGLAVVLLPYTGPDWFTGSGWSASRRLSGSGIGVVVLATGVVGLVTLASSAALRYDASIQFLQLLSALDIGWVVAAFVVGGRRLWSRTAAIASGATVGVVCVWSIWNYLSAVGFGPNGEWIVSGTDLMTRVLPYDMAAGAIAVALFLAGTRKAAQAIEQPNPQS
ncbi:MAG: hypothetical protein O3B42_05325 [Actinomycetota bacterium]|nr:hypothetical protein [Actinomycetota bacterium]